MLHDTGRATYVPVTDDEAVEMPLNIFPEQKASFRRLSLLHAVAYAKKLAPAMGKDQIIVINISGRGDKDCAAIARYRGENIYD